MCTLYFCTNLPILLKKRRHSEINKIETKSWHRFGAPSVRSDLPPPRVRRVDDTKNYGDEGNAGLLISPSICETFGVYQSDIYQKRPMDEIKQLYSKMEIEVADQNIESIWNEIAGKNLTVKYRFLEGHKLCRFDRNTFFAQTWRGQNFTCNC
mgnify:CR=1 FL=1